MNKMIKVGIIGAGSICSSHIEGFRRAGADVIAVCSRNREKLNALNKGYDISILVEKPEEIFSNKEIDAVSVVTPSFLYRNDVIEALKCNKNVLVEKPRVSLEISTMQNAAG